MRLWPEAEPVLILKDQIIVRFEIVGSEQVQTLVDLGKLLKRLPNYPFYPRDGLDHLVSPGDAGGVPLLYSPSIPKEERFVALLGLVLVFVAFSGQGLQPYSL